MFDAMFHWAAVLCIGIYSVFLVRHIRRHRRRHNQEPIVRASPDTAHGYLGALIPRLGLLAYFFLIATAFRPDLADWFGRIAVLDRPYVAIAGAVLFIGGTALMALAQVQMGASWKMGIDPAATPALVTTGIFGRSRHPIYLATIAVLLGAFLIVPTALTAVVFALGWVVFQVQARLEEQFLRQLHGEAYERFALSVRRWV